MAKVTLQRAAELTGKARSTIHRAMKSGKLSFERDATGTRLIDVAELERVFGLPPQPSEERNGAAELQRHDMHLVELRLQLELERTKATMLEERLRDMRDERDRWRSQAERLLTDQRERAERPRRWWQRWRRAE